MMKSKIIFTTLLIEKSPQAIPLGAACVASAVKNSPLTKDLCDVELLAFNIEDFENFCKNEAKYGNLFIDASIQNRLKSIILSNMVYLTAFEDADKDTSINLMRAGFYKNKIKVCKSCLGTRTDIARLRFTSDSVSEGVNRVASLDEGYAGCLRALITYDKGLNSVWY